MRHETVNEALQPSGSARRRRRLILHIGDYKSGSTSIQQFLRRNKDLLAENGIYFPCEKSAYYMQWGQHVLLATALTGRGVHWLTEESAKLPPLEILTQFRNDIDKSPAHTVVVSSEAFFGLCRAPHLTRQVMNLFPDFDPTVIVYIRRQDAHLVSGFQQRCKRGRRHPFNQWKRIIERRSGFYLRRLKSWEKAVGRENVIVRPFEVEQWKDQNLIADFIHAAGIPEAVDWEIPSRRNEGMGLESVLMLQRFNRWIWLQGHDPRIWTWQRCRQWVRKHDKFISKQSLTKIMSPEQRMTYFKMFEAENSEIARRYLQRDGSPLFNVLPPSAKNGLESEERTVDTIRRTIELIRLRNARMQARLEKRGVDVSAALALQAPKIDPAQASENQLFQLFAFEARKLFTLKRCRPPRQDARKKPPLNWPKTTLRSLARQVVRRFADLFGL